MYVELFNSSPKRKSQYEGDRIVVISDGHRRNFPSATITIMNAFPRLAEPCLPVPSVDAPAPNIETWMGALMSGRPPTKHRWKVLPPTIFVPMIP